MAEQWTPVARVGDVKRGDVIAVSANGIAMCLGLDGDRYFASQRHCVHRGTDLSDGIVSRGHLICPQHAWRFSTATGQHAEASEYCLVMYPVRVTGDVIEIDPSAPSAPNAETMQRCHDPQSA